MSYNYSLIVKRFLNLKSFFENKGFSTEIINELYESHIHFNTRNFNKSKKCLINIMVSTNLTDEYFSDSFGVYYYFLPKDEVSPRQRSSVVNIDVR